MPTVHPKQILSLHHVTEEELGGLGHSQRGSPAFLRDTLSSPLSVLRQCRTKGTQCSTVGAVPPPQGWVLVIATQPIYAPLPRRWSFITGRPPCLTDRPLRHLTVCQPSALLTTGARSNCMKSGTHASPFLLCDSKPQPTHPSLVSC